MATVQTPAAPAAARNAPDGDARLRALLGSINEALHTANGCGASEAVDPAGTRPFGYGCDELLGRSFAALLGDPSGDEYCSYLRSFGGSERPAVPGSPRELMGRRGDGASLPPELTLTEAPEMPVLVAVAREITERHKAEDQQRQFGDFDPVTGLYNRRRFEQELDIHIRYAARHGSGGSVLLLDLDNFKYANDCFGNRAGEVLLCAVASLLKGRLRKTDVLARLGGGEFGMLLDDADIAKAQTVAEELRALIGDNPFVIDRQRVRATVSLGIATISREVVSADELIARADRAKDEAREAGRDPAAAFDPGGPITPEAMQVWSDQVHEAVEQERFVIHAQPILDLASDRISQYELLIRMRGEDGELVPAASFLDTAERFGLVQGLDRWVAQQAVRLIESHKRAGRELVLGVNLSGKTLADQEFATGLGGEMVRAGIEPSNLIFEVTETASIADIEQARRFAESLARMGCRFALDDFGSGFASFYYLKHLPIHVLKIDGEFIKDLPRAPDDQLIVSALVQVARGMGMKTTAEFVEDAETLEILRRLGVDHAQGYHIGRPTPVDELAARAPVA